VKKAILYYIVQYSCSSADDKRKKEKKTIGKNVSTETACYLTPAVELQDIRQAITFWVRELNFFL
jgi:hypothetical protein